MTTHIDCETCKYYDWAMGDYGVGEWCDSPQVRSKFIPHTLQGHYDPNIINKRYDCGFYERKIGLLERMHNYFWRKDERAEEA